MSDFVTARDILKTLVAFDTTSHRSNLKLIEWVEGYLADHGITCNRVPNESGQKSNLFATCGPIVKGGVILSGHSDVVPVVGQDWSADPFTLREADGRFYGRGTSDMKGFIALGLAFASRFAAGNLPVHFAISYDEEIGCQGAPAMIERMRKVVPTPRLAIVGEPSSMRVVTGHKSITVHEVSVRGQEAHSSLVDHGVSAIMVAIDLMAQLSRLAKTLRDRADPNNGFDPPYATLTVGEMEGGTAANILAGHARFVFDLRCPPDEDASDVLAPFIASCESKNDELAAQFYGAGVRIEKLANAPAMTPAGSEDAVAFVRKLTGENAEPSRVSYATEGGQFQQAGYPTVICGPGSIEQAHQPDEWMAVSQFEAGVRFMERLAAALS